ncbi:hypothetical protein [Confluentibacter flavum]|uniref:Uncharacterized protein n=1 Tax=Confluentibacter flavum TaxID=1909700 RepID=A0A2N3HL08_9FLAO|nr:hypothetical protein [Confluentibacter flavum]PKQ45636.1 hypothetical protein CSW08_06085 [Confluentibacter flavum]
MKQERKKRLRQLALWTWSWVATLALATFGPKFIWDHHPFLSTFAVIVNCTNGILMIIANRHLFNDFDQLERKIHLEAMGITLGLTVVFALTYALLDRINIISFNAEISVVVLFIGLTYLVSMLINSRRYR